jgi:glucan phosphorylase
MNKPLGDEATPPRQNNSGRRTRRRRQEDVPVAYFTMEIALSEEMPTYSGGLGVLAGDTIRSAADSPSGG